MYPNLKLEMWRSGMRQNHLARMLKLDETTLSRILNGFRKPYPELKDQIAAVLGRDAAWLFDESECRTRESKQMETSGAQGSQQKSPA
jgi:transcriptional regulator with XRE-family HTH domain